MLSFKFVTVYSLKAPPASVKSQTKTTFENGVSEQINTKVVLSVLGLKGVCYKGNVFFNLLNAKTEENNILLCFFFASSKPILGVICNTIEISF